MDDFQGLKSHKEGRSIKKAAEHAWNNSQRLCAGAFHSTACEVILTSLVLFSFVLVVLEADYGANVPSWLTVTNNVLMVVYILEMVIRLFIYQWYFFTVPFNVFDLTVVVLEGVSHVAMMYIEGERASAIPSVAPLRVVRLFRIARGYRVIMKFPQLALMVKGLSSAASAAAYGCVLLGIILTIWGVFAVHFIQPIVSRISADGGYAGCDRCMVAFATVRNSMLTFTQQIIAGDSWGQVTMPIIEESPYTSMFFLAVFVSVNFTIMNVILAVIVDSALKASQGDVDEVLKHKAEAAHIAKDYLAELCKELATRSDGALTEADLKRGFEEHPDFRDILMTMDIKSEDMSVVFSILDVDANGTVDCEEFVSELFKMKAHDSHTLLVFIKHYSMEIRKDVQTQLGLLKTSMYDVFQRFLEEEQKQSTISIAQKDKVLKSFERGNSLNVLLDCKARSGTAVGLGLSPRVSGSSDHPPLPATVPEEQSLEQKTLKEELGAELRRLRAVVSEELVVSMQQISKKLEVEDDGCKARKADEKQQFLWTRLDQRESKLAKQAHNSGADLGGDTVQSTPRGPSGLHIPSSVWGIRNSGGHGGPVQNVHSTPIGKAVSGREADDLRTSASAPSAFRGVG